MTEPSRASQELASDIEALYRSGAVTLPEMAAEYATARSVVAADYSSVFWRPAGLGTDPSGAYAVLQTATEALMARMESQLRRTGDALVMTAREYSRADEHNRNEFVGLVADVVAQQAEAAAEGS